MAFTSLYELEPSEMQLISFRPDSDKLQMSEKILLRFFIAPVSWPA